jgi:hypothetical protein
MPGQPALPDPLGLCGLDENVVFDNASPGRRQPATRW